MGHRHSGRTDRPPAVVGRLASGEIFNILDRLGGPEPCPEQPPGRRMDARVWVVSVDRKQLVPKATNDLPVEGGRVKSAKSEYQPPPLVVLS
jgi:hypothetical protein